MKGRGIYVSAVSKHSRPPGEFDEIFSGDTTKPVSYDNRQGFEKLFSKPKK